MHQTGRHRRFAVVKDMNLLYRRIATVDIVELQLILIEHQTVHRERIGAREVLCIGDDDATHREPDWRFRAVTGNSSHLIEMAQVTGIVGHLDRELLTGRDLTGIVDKLVQPQSGLILWITRRRCPLFCISKVAVTGC